ncbi:MAG: AAA family ATPase, partial [Candidatus Margulisiibacteriota bacterium]
MLEDFNILLKDIGHPRTDYLSQITSALNTRLVKVLMGQRRSGKSYILRQMIQSLLAKGVQSEEIFYLNKELHEFDEVSDYKQLIQLIEDHKKKHKVDNKMYVLLDEIQWIAGWEKAVNSLSQHPSNDYELIISGSNSDLLHGELATLLSGRYIVFEILPFSYNEYIGITKQEKNKASYINYLQQGGLPEIFHLQGEELRRHYIMALLDT